MSHPPLRFLYPPRLLRTNRPLLSLKITPSQSRHLQQRHGTAVDPASTLPSSPSTSEAPKFPDEPPPNPPQNSHPTPAPIGSSLSSPSSSAPATTAIPSDPVSDPPPPTSSSPLHNIDTYALTRILTPAFTPSQSTALVETLNSLLTSHLTHASTHYLSRSHHLNSLYLLTTSLTSFRNEISVSRLSTLSTLRAERARLQAELDALQQRFMVEVLEMHNEIRGDWEEWRGRGRQELRERENKLQELNYKITVRLKGGVAEEVERVRWVVMRRGLVGIAALAVVLVSGIRISGMRKKKEKEEKEEAKEREKREVEVSFGPVAGKANSIGEGLAGLG